MHYSFKNTLNSMGTQVSATESIRLTHAQSVQFTKCSSPVQLITTIRNVYRLIDAPKTLSIFSENTPNKGKTLMIKSDNEKVKDYYEEELTFLKKRIKTFPAEEIIDVIKTVKKFKFPADAIIEAIKRVKGTSRNKRTLH